MDFIQKITQLTSIVLTKCQLSRTVDRGVAAVHILLTRPVRAPDDGFLNFGMDYFSRV